MRLALIRKTLRDTRIPLIAAAAAIAAFEYLFVFAVDTHRDELHTYLNIIPPFAKRMMRLMAGADIFSHLTPTGLMSIGLVHPFLLAVLSVFSFAYCSRVLAGEIDAGTADLLLTLPLRRSGVYVSLTAVWAVAGLCLCTAPLLGVWIAQRFWQRGPFEMDRLAMVCVNLFALYVSVGATSLMFSAMMSRRWRTIALLVTLMLTAFVVNFLSAIWPPAERIAFLSVLHYYQPLPTIAEDRWPLHDLSILALTALLAWLIGLVVFTRRDIRTA